MVAPRVNRGSHEKAAIFQRMVKILREADAESVAAVAKKHGICDQTIYLWRQPFEKPEPVDVKRLRGPRSVIGRLLVRRQCGVTS